MNAAECALAMQRLAELRSLAAELSHAISGIQVSLLACDSAHTNPGPTQDFVGPLLNRMQELHTQMRRIPNIRGAMPHGRL